MPRASGPAAQRGKKKKKKTQNMTNPVLDISLSCPASPVSRIAEHQMRIAVHTSVSRTEYGSPVMTVRGVNSKFRFDLSQATKRLLRINAFVWAVAWLLLLVVGLI